MKHRASRGSCIDGTYEEAWNVLAAFNNTSYMQRLKKLVDAKSPKEKKK